MIFESLLIHISIYFVINANYYAFFLQFYEFSIESSLFRQKSILSRISTISIIFNNSYFGLAERSFSFSSEGIAYFKIFRVLYFPKTCDSIDCAI